MDIVMCGVGGQGTVLASRVLGQVAINASWQVRTSEIIGMAQRGGSVVSQVRIGRDLNGPLIPDKAADFLIGFELAEAVRNINKVAPQGKIIVNTQKVVPPSVHLGTSVYDEKQLINFLQNNFAQAVLIDALDIARQAGSAKTVSAVMLGAFSAVCSDLDADDIQRELVAKLPDKLQEINIQAFNKGREFAEG
ncbi:MAG: indolepyruvate oxidoreductase subunit beta [Syntrophomonadaceae bacterium]|jgi:indolepyruvate ferredoxin oxidoreductase beta subunit